MIQISDFIDFLRKSDVGLFAGVPDSLLKAVSSYLAGSPDHVICANEGACIAMAGGHFLATGKLGLVYLQNSGFGNAINPILSLASREAYGLPMLMLIGWRGEPGTQDEPQHTMQGRLTIPLLETLEIPHAVIESTTENWKELITGLITGGGDLDRTIKRDGPVALVCRAGLFESQASEFVEEERYSLTRKVARYPLSREDALAMIVDSADERDIFVVTTGMASREIFELRERAGQRHAQDFLTVGAMGHANQLALAIAREKRERTVYCIDGDGSVIMHMGALAICGRSECKNFRHIVLNNGSHDSVGGQPTVGLEIDLCGVARAVGYKQVCVATNENELRTSLRQIGIQPGPAMLEVRIKKGARADLGRPTKSLTELRDDFANFVRKR